MIYLKIGICVEYGGSRVSQPTTTPRVRAPEPLKKPAHKMLYHLCIQKLPSQKVSIQKVISLKTIKKMFSMIEMCPTINPTE